MDGIMLSKVSQAEKDKHCMISPFFFFPLHCEACGILVPLHWECRVLTIGLPDLTFMWNVKNKQKAELIQKPRTDWWMNKGGHKGNSSSYKIGESLGCNIQHGDYGYCIFKSCWIPWWLVVKNPPANAEDTGSIPHPRRSHVPQSN